ncbi:MAG: hypothetical protein IJZ47_08970 [Oscillospiraceae bacterium]|nr:hypothetical protein [Oscillospiraceae bacterium]
MLTEILIATGGALIGTALQVNKSSNIDAQAMRKYAKAFSREQEAKRLIEQKEKEADDSILKLARRKKAIIDTTIKDFLEIYESVQKINFENGEGIKELTALTISNADIAELNGMSVSCSKMLTEKELVVGLLFKGIALGGGIGGMMIKDSERTLSAANSQMRAANVSYSQAETIATMYDAVKDRAERMATLLKKMNVLTVKSIIETKRLLSVNGTNVKSYQPSDKVVVMNCVNFVVAMKKILDAPLFNQTGELEQQSIKAISDGEAYINQINQII